MINNSEITALLKSTELFKKALMESFSTISISSNHKSELVANSLDIVFEHSDAINLLISNSLFTTALAVFRLQYDALVRQIWLLYAASDSEIEKLSAPLTNETAQSVNNWIPSTNQMLKDIEIKAPAVVYKNLIEFKTNSSKPLNSFVHTGIHAIATIKNGVYFGVIISVIKQSNNLLHMSSLALAIDSGNQNLMLNVVGITKKFSDCLDLAK